MTSPTRILRPLIAVAVAISIVGCAASRAGPRGQDIAQNGWRAMATQSDRERLRNWRDAWIAALARARAADPAGVAAEGDLFDPDRALAGAVPPDGNYRCRVFKLGAKGTAMAEFMSYRDGDCRIDTVDGVTRFVKLAGVQRPSGIIFRDDDARATFLGAMMLGVEERPMRHGRDAGRDVTGYVERVADRKWRLVLPYPRFESMLDVIELVPMG